MWVAQSIACSTVPVSSVINSEYVTLFEFTPGCVIFIVIGTPVIGIPSPVKTADITNGVDTVDKCNNIDWPTKP